MKRSAAERVRLQHALGRMRSCIDSIEIALAQTAPPGTQEAQSILETAGTVVIGLAKLDAYQRAEEDQ